LLVVIRTIKRSLESKANWYGQFYVTNSEWQTKHYGVNP